MTMVSGIFKHRLGWCPNHPAASAQPVKNSATIHLILIACLLAVPIAALAITFASAPSDAVWIFSRDSTGTAHFVKRIVVSPVISGIFSPAPGEASTRELPGGEYFMVIQHPRPGGTFDIVLDGAWVLDRQLTPPGVTGGTRLFDINGPVSFQGDDAGDALVAAIDNPPLSSAGEVPKA